jgi:hypothetical protein
MYAKWYLLMCNKNLEHLKECLRPQFSLLEKPTSRLCTRGAYYVPYSCLLISNKFWKGEGGAAEQGEQVPLCISPSTPSVWDLKPSSWALVHKTTFAPMIYTDLCIMFWMCAYPLLGQVGGDWALEFSSFLGPKWHSPIGFMPFHRAQKTLKFQGPTPSHLPS